VIAVTSTDPPPERERGFALLATLLALVAISIVAAAGSFLARSDGRISLSHRATVEARELARTGLSEFLASPSGGGTSRIFVHGRDTAEVTARRLLFVTADSSRSLLRLVARGVRVRRGRPNAVREVSAVVLGVAPGDTAGSTPALHVEESGTRHEPGSP